MNENVQYSYSVRVYCREIWKASIRVTLSRFRIEWCVPHEQLARLRGVTTGGSAPGRRHGRRAGSGLRWSCGGATAVLRRVLLEQGLAELVSKCVSKQRGCHGLARRLRHATRYRDAGPRHTDLHTHYSPGRAAALRCPRSPRSTRPRPRSTPPRPPRATRPGPRAARRPSRQSRSCRRAARRLDKG